MPIPLILYGANYKYRIQKGTLSCNKLGRSIITLQKEKDIVTYKKGSPIFQWPINFDVNSHDLSRTQVPLLVLAFIKSFLKSVTNQANKFCIAVLKIM